MVTDRADVYGLGIESPNGDGPTREDCLCGDISTSSARVPPRTSAPPVRSCRLLGVSRPAVLPSCRYAPSWGVDVARAAGLVGNSGPGWRVGCQPVTRQGRSAAEDPRSGLAAVVDRAC